MQFALASFLVCILWRISEVCLLTILLLIHLGFPLFLWLTWNRLTLKRIFNELNSSSVTHLEPGLGNEASHPSSPACSKLPPWTGRFAKVGVYVLPKDPLIGSSLFASGLLASDSILDLLSIYIFKGMFQKSIYSSRKAQRLPLNFRTKICQNPWQRG